ncbi:molybdopterin-dependent oxidoreductase [Sulfobacillus thermotolerans]
MLGEAGYLTNIPQETLEPMIEWVEDVEPSLPPVFTLSDIESAMRKSRIKRTKTVCTYCGVGCSFDIWTKGRQVLKVEPSPEAPTNGISTCIKGKFGWDFVNSPQRLTQPLIRRGDAFYEATWEEAYRLIAERMLQIKKQHGPDSFMFIASSKATNEEAYLLQKLARHAIGTNNVDNDSTYCQDPATYGLRQTVGFGGDSGSVSDIAQADMVMIVGSNTAESHPVVATRVKRAHKLHGQKLVVVDIRRHEMAERADIFVQPNPGTDGVWILGISKYLIDQDWIDHDFLAQWVTGFEDYKEFLAPYSLEHTRTITGVPEQTTMQVASMIHEAHSLSILWAMGVTQHRDGSETSLAIANLLLLTGNFARPGTGAYPLRGHNNVQGASDFGAKPHYLPGYQDPADPEVRERFKAAWGKELPKTRGINNQELAGAILQGRIKMVTDGKAHLVALTMSGMSQVDAKYDLHINNGQLLEHFHEGNMTYQSAGIRHVVPGMFVEVSPELAHERNLQDGTMVRLVSPTGSLTAPVLITNRVSGKALYVPMNSLGEGAVNNITGTGIDTRTSTPAYKETRAYMEVVDPQGLGRSPLPRRNWRFKHRHPQRGVNVAAKWARRDYIPLVTAQKHLGTEETLNGTAHN